MTTQTNIIKIEHESLDEMIKELEKLKESLDPETDVNHYPLLEAMGKVDIHVKVIGFEVRITIEW